MLRIKVPATSANLGPGFDLAGIALDMYNEFFIYYSGKEEEKPEGCKVLPEDSLVHRAVRYVEARVKKEMPPLEIALRARVPRAKGLGSSATLSLAGLVAGNVLLEAGLDNEELLNMAAVLEGHPDNAAPALLGGLVICMAHPEGFKYFKLMPSKPLQVVVAVPDFEVKTADSRQVLPREISHRDAVKNTGRFGFFIASILTGDYTHLAFAMEDLLHQRYRQGLIPGLKEVISSALASGALGSCLSGAGPSILAFCDSRCQQIGEEMKSAWGKMGIQAETYILDIASEGTLYEFG
ncbi:MAG: homoserine kinase [Peptococcaceae bacterium]|jgi:homoserine kinase|nr:homoserine kinase [Peptococcaceae bacterium]MDH7525243.1 homoserine kinase [Peptococcaceae bacterium]